jgi:hypothetical protein
VDKSKDVRWARHGAYMVKGLLLVNLKEKDRMKTEAYRVDNI